MALFVAPSDVACHFAFLIAKHIALLQRPHTTLELSICRLDAAPGGASSRQPAPDSLSSLCRPPLWCDRRLEAA